MQELFKDIIKKLESEGQNPKTYFEGLIHGKPMNYWDYIQTDALLSLQTQKSNVPDEMVFIVYHQINELLFKMILWEIEQVAFAKDLKAPFFQKDWIESVVTLIC